MGIGLVADTVNWADPPGAVALLGSGFMVMTGGAI